MSPLSSIAKPVRLQELRNSMKLAGIDAYLFPSGDAHQSEYIAQCDARRAFISGFTGSAGYAVVTLNDAALWTDGRYFLQASRELDTASWKLMKMGLPGTPEKSEWLQSVLGQNAKIGFDPRLLSVEDFVDMKQKLTGLKLVAALDKSGSNLVDAVWKDRPARPANPLIVHDVKYAGQDYLEKLASIRKYMSDYKFDASTGSDCKVAGLLIPTLDEICWTLNLRGSDIPFNPVFFAYLLVTPSSSVLFTDKKRVDDSVLKHLKASNTVVEDYNSIWDHLKGLSKQWKASNSKLLADRICSVAVQESLVEPALLQTISSPIKMLKSIKNPVELEGFRQCHVRDAAALCNFFGWLENELVVNNNTSISEVDAADKVEGFRAEQADFMGLSFDTISSTGPNGAIIHYKPEKDTCAIIDKTKVYLCDSGAQYKDGTTDVTRTYHFTHPTDFEKLAFTRVLQGHIALDALIFPNNVSGYQIDSFARQALWRSGLDYMHGTGHGVGSFLNVHEGPQGISFKKPHDEVKLQVNMTVTNEPGYYHDNHFGIRIENILFVKEAATPHQFAGKKYLGFEHVTFVPIGKKLIDKSLLSQAEIEWIDKYHTECWQKVSQLLKKDSLGWKWLQKETSPL